MKIKTLLLTAMLTIPIYTNAIASPTLSRNSIGKDVLTLQKKLYIIGYEITELDGVFGNETERAVSAFQHDQRIDVTGIVTNVTWRALKKAKPVKGRSLSDLKVIPINSIKTISTVKNPNSTIEQHQVSYGKTFITRQQGTEIIATAKEYMGVPYVFGGTTPSGFDCSGFLQYVFKKHGFLIPRLADEQYNLGYSAKISQLNVGDLVFFSTYMEGASHCGFYVGDEKFLHTSSSRGVRIDSLNNDYWRPRFLGARKIVED